MKKNKILIYIIFLLGISYLLQVYILMNGGVESEAFETLAPIIMFLPAILTILIVIITKEGLKSINWKLGKPIYLIYAAFIPSILALTSIIIISSLGWGEITHFNYVGNKFEILKGRFIMGQGTQSIVYFIFNYILTTFVFSIVSGLFAFGEELGWRGYLQNRMIYKKGILSGIVILGLIWGFWHFPIILNGYNYPENPILGAFILFPFTTIFASFFLAWLTLKAKSFWPAVIAHGSVNAFIGSFVAGMDYQNGNRLYADIFVLILWGLIAFLSYKSIHKLEITVANNVYNS